MPETGRVLTEYIRIISAASWLLKKKSITMHGNMNVKTLLQVGKPQRYTVTTLIQTV
jgi:hypothetical protein